MHRPAAGDPALRARAIEERDDTALSIFDSNVPEFFTTGERVEFESFVREPPGPYIAVEDVAGDVVACGGYAVDSVDGRGDLCWGMVRRELQGRGIGRFLTMQRIDAMRADPRVQRITLSTSHLTEQFYRQLGFITTTTVENAFAPGLHRCDMVLVIDRDDRGSSAAGS